MKNHSKPIRFAQDILTHTPLVKMIILLIGLWLIFSAGIFLSEQSTGVSTITSYGEALYWGVAAFSTAGIADTPVSGLSKITGGIWIILGSALFFGTILVAFFVWRFIRPLNIFIVTEAFERPINTEKVIEPLKSLGAEECGSLLPSRNI